MAKRTVTMLFLYPSSTCWLSFNTNVKIIKPTTTELPKIISLTTTAQPIVTTIAQRKSNLFTLWKSLSFDKCEDSLVVRANTSWQHIELNCSSARFLNSNPPHGFLTWWMLSGSNFNWHWVCHKTSMFCRSQSTLSTSILNTCGTSVVDCC